MENNEDWIKKWAGSMKYLLTDSNVKLKIIMKDLSEDPNKTSEDVGDLWDVHSMCYELACKVGGWYERKYPTIVPWLPKDSATMTLRSSKSPWSVVLCADSEGDELQLPLLRNRIVLPEIEERANVVITHVLPSMAFYVVFEDKYSDVVDQRGIETYTTLFNRMNHPLSAIKYKPLADPPSNGQLVVFRSRRSRTWLRGVVIQVCSNSVTLHNPDLGNSEVLPTKDLKTIAEEDTILPFQAVLSFLHNIGFAENCTDEAKELFVELISCKKLHVVVKAVDVNKSAMEVILFSSDGVNINKALVASGYCLPLYRTST